MLRRSTLLFALLALCAGDQWLMAGDFISDGEAERHNLLLDSTNSTTSVSSSIRITLTPPMHHTINCIIAAALHLNGDVSVVDGGVGSNSVTLAYKTLNSQPDQFFVLMESNVDRQWVQEALEMRGDAVETSRLAIFYDKMRDWKASPVVGVADFGNDGAREHRDE
ncbi:uncharacterized protein LOC100680061 [Nasonia vitripennis]|uniref:Uncharacterized protein n=1 Tax=Nasonia vitripennis TaxID=7425 RepID=A0A7M7GFQ1_NASVI|nr:uncharacterized protein LOC100680061 [Nasonia vitripennis]